MTITSQWDAYCGDMVVEVPPIPREHACGAAREILGAQPDWPGLAVCTAEGRVLGYVSRNKLLQLLSKPLMADLYTKRPVELIMDKAPLTVEIGQTLDEVCARIAGDRSETLADGFVITAGGFYRGLGSINATLGLTVQQASRRANCMAREKEEVERALRQLHEAHADLNKAHAELNKVNRHISESINYASRIQTSLLPNRSHLDGLLYDMALGWSPRDVVGGDFYWVGRFGERCLLAVMDCTGHGVPGAFMTAIVASVLDRILHEHCHDDPARILELLNRLVKTTLHQDENASADAFQPDDGLDAAVCMVDIGRRSLTFAGARIPLLYSLDGELHEIKSDRHSLGYRTSQIDYRFTNHMLALHPGMSFYLATDGVTDQVGGPHRRLFGRRRLVEALGTAQGLPMERQMELVMSTLATYRGHESLRDDMTFIGFTPMAPERKELAQVG